MENASPQSAQSPQPAPELVVSAPRVDALSVPKRQRSREQIEASWRHEDALQATGLPYGERMAISTQRIEDADTVRGTSAKLERTLRLEALAIAPDRHDDMQDHNAHEAIMLLTRSIGSHKERKITEVQNITRLHDIIALDAFWTAREAQTELGQQTAKLLLGSLILDSVQEILALSKMVYRGADSGGSVQHVKGMLAEFMYITWERLHLYREADPGRIGQVFIRSGSPSEDESNKDTTKSCDAVIMTFDDEFAPDEDRKPGRAFLQYKTNKDRRKYDPSIKVVHIPDWDVVLDNVEEVAKHFQTLVKSPGNANEQLVSLAALGGYFAGARVEELSKARAHAYGRRRGGRRRGA